MRNNLQNGIKFRTQPKLHWETIKSLGSMGGGINAGIAKVRTKDDPLGRVFIEKRFSADHILYKIAHKEMALLYQVGDHPYITTLIDHFVDEMAKKASVYMEFCDRGSLMDILSIIRNGQQRVNEHKLWRWFIQSMDALVYCHRGHEPDNDRAVMNWARIYHRDLKPANILLTRTEVEGKMQIVAKLADFGCAQSDEWTVQTKPRSSASQASAGSPGFDQPEFPRFSGSSDVWQLALVFVCMCGLRGSPRSRQNPQGTQWNRDRPAGPGYSNELSSVLKWCLDKDPTTRPEALDVLESLKHAYNEVKTRLPPDNQPLEIFDPLGNQRPYIPHPMPSPGHGPPMFYPGFGQHPGRPGPPRHPWSDPEVGRIGRIPNDYVSFVNGRRSPLGGLLGIEPFELPPDDLANVLEDDDDPHFYGGMDPRLLGGVRLRQGHLPRFHPAYRRRYQ
ncbi:Nn.00g078690.m01.CDS01 [Neocucurbitaria sp. VM-36]